MILKRNNKAVLIVPNLQAYLEATIAKTVILEKEQIRAGMEQNRQPRSEPVTEEQRKYKAEKVCLRTTYDKEVD